MITGEAIIRVQKELEDVIQEHLGKIAKKEELTNPMKKITKTIKPLNIVLFDKSGEALKADYEKAKSKYIAGYEKEFPSFWGTQWVRDSVQGEAEWNKYYPEGLKNWATRQGDTLSSLGQQILINKVDELIAEVNSLKKEKKSPKKPKK